MVWPDGYYESTCIPAGASTFCTLTADVTLDGTRGKLTSRFGNHQTKCGLVFYYRFEYPSEDEITLSPASPCQVIEGDCYCEPVDKIIAFSVDASGDVHLGTEVYTPGVPPAPPSSSSDSIGLVPVICISVGVFLLLAAVVFHLYRRRKARELPLAPPLIPPPSMGTPVV